jgi:hypothetical protein
MAKNGCIVIVPSVVFSLQRELFEAALRHIGVRDLTNTVVEARFVGDEVRCSEYGLPAEE